MSNSQYENVTQELQSKINSSYYRVVQNHEIELRPKPKDVQKDNSGNYVVNVKTPEFPGVCFELEGQKVVAFLQVQNCADDIIVIFNDDDTITLHIIEFKSKLNDTEWLKVKKQFEGAFYRFKAICGVIGFNQPIKDTILYTTFREDKVLTDETTSFILGKAEVGIPESSANIQDWHSPKISILEQKLVHKKVQLNVPEDNIGYQSIQL
ncbi:MAG: hypothetical protein AB2401_02570 [Bacillus sp. (in: firmicutes)]